jgi:hypothetical protein
MPPSSLAGQGDTLGPAPCTVNSIIGLLNRLSNNIDGAAQRAVVTFNVYKMASLARFEIRQKPLIPQFQPCRSPA